ncbi:MAG: hypothetical protein QOD30_1595 [Actinomycetota bacterium]|jgi:hypothetical protein|nr:hypothetical protein [Actinomycetota bacterium]
MRRLGGIGLVCALVAIVVSPAAAAGSASADKEGWWSNTGRAVPDAAVPDTVPSGAIGIAAAGGSATKVAAIGVVLDAAKGSAVQTFTLTMKEADGTGAQQNSAGASIIACPITDFFSGEQNGKLADAPAADCETAKSEGKRNDDGTWTFDLSAIADEWLDPFGTIPANGLRFDPGDGTFQVSLTGKDDAAFDVALTPPQEESDPFDSSTTTIAGGFTGSSSSAGSSGGDITVPPPPDVVVATSAPAATGGSSPPTAAGDAAPATPAASRAGDTGGNLPGGVPLLVLVLLGGGALVALALGSAGRRRPESVGRSGGVSRALEARATSNTGVSR